MTRLDADWLHAPAARAVMAMLAEAGHAGWYVGGCVRNTLLGRSVNDIDIATDARPERVTALAEALELRVVPTGVSHGTVTVIAEGEPFEVTTFRRDVETDGRRAVVAFTDVLEEDAVRRDFTMNALYASADGLVRDPVGGLEDLAAGRLRFVGNAAERIAEDGLRVLRFFRFQAQYLAERTPDPEALAAIAAAPDALAPVSAERIGAEMAKLLQASDPERAIAVMAETGVLARVLEGAEPTVLARLLAIERAESVDAGQAWLRRLVSLDREVTRVSDWAERLRVSRRDRTHLRQVATCLEGAVADGEAAHVYGPEIARDALLIRHARGGPPPPRDWPKRIATAAAAHFPLRAADLMPPLEPGPALGAELDRLRADWIASGFALSRDDLLARL